MPSWSAADLAAFRAKEQQRHKRPSASGPIGVPEKPAAPLGDVRTMLELASTKDESGLNQVEKKFWAWIQLQGLPWVGCQCITLKLADDTRLTPDFVALKDGKIVFYDTKHKRLKNGVRRLFVEEDAHIKFKVAARQFRWAEFYYVTEGGETGWEFKKVDP